jgi:hydrogenase maturation protease
MKRPRILVAGVGNIFFGDDAFGVEVARRLMRRELPDEVRVVDFGIRGLDLTYALLDGYEAVILVDAAPRGGRPGTLYVLDATGATSAEGAPLMEAHGMDPLKVLRLAAAMGGCVGRLLVVGCEPAPPADSDEMRAGLSDAAAAAVEEAVPLVESLVARLVRSEEVAAGYENLVTGKEGG